jgi:hypothetical protein
MLYSCLLSRDEFLIMVSSRQFRNSSSETPRDSTTLRTFCLNDGVDINSLEASFNFFL